jgi:hypothetical protein
MSYDRAEAKAAAAGGDAPLVLTYRCGTGGCGGRLGEVRAVPGWGPILVGRNRRPLTRAEQAGTARRLREGPAVDTVVTDDQTPLTDDQRLEMRIALAVSRLEIAGPPTAAEIADLDDEGRMILAILNEKARDALGARAGRGQVINGGAMVHLDEPASFEGTDVELKCRKHGIKTLALTDARADVARVLGTAGSCDVVLR